MLPNKFFSAIMINVIFVKVLLTFPKTVVVNSANAAWIQVLYNVIVALLFFMAVTQLYNRKKNVIEVAALNYGKTVKIITGIIVILVLTANLIPVIRIFSTAIKTVLLKETELEIIILITAVAAALGAYLGIESIGRISTMFMPIAAVIFAAFIIMLIPDYKAENIFPLLGNGWKSIFINGISSLSLFSDLIILNLLIPFTENLDTVRKYGRYTIIVSGCAAVIVTLMYCLTYSYPTTKNFIMPVYQMTRMVNFSSFFSRFEAFFEFVWSIMILLYISVYLYMMSYTLQITFSLKYVKPLIYPVTVAVFMTAMLPQSMMEIMELSSVIGKYSYIPVFLLLLIFSRVRRKKC